MKNLILFLSLCLYISPVLSQNIDTLNDKIDDFLEKVVQDGKIDYRAAKSHQVLLEEILSDIASANDDNLSKEEKTSLYVNAYNIIVINKIVDQFPVSSVKKIPGFFKQKNRIAGRSLSLDEIEKDLLSEKDGRLHMILICGANGCPPIEHKALPVSSQEGSIEAWVSKAMQEKHIVEIDHEKRKLTLSQIFKWYASDFDDVRSFVQKYFPLEDVSDYGISYQPYDWSVNNANDQQIETFSEDDASGRYYVSDLYEKGEFEINVFNNYYSQLDPSDSGDQRSNFFSSFWQVLYGINNRLNLGLDVKFRSVTSGSAANVGKWDAFKFRNDGFGGASGEGDLYTRIGVTAIIPKIKYQPFKNNSNISVQHGIAIPVLSAPEGNENNGYIDWGAPSFFNDLFYDQDLGARSSLFLQFSVNIENINSAFFRAGDGYYQFSTPITLIYNYFPTQKSTFYLLVNAAPNWGYNVSNGGDEVAVIPDHFNQYGMGFKYFLTDSIQGELLYTKFFSSVPERSAATYNFGFRYFGWN